MSQQPKSWQKQILKERSHADLFWYPEAQLPVSQRRNRFDDGYTPVGYPGRWIPLIPVAPNAEGSRKLADMLCSLFRMCVPDMLEVTPVLTDVKSLKATGALYYTWTDEIMLDVMCASCGAIERIPHTVAEDAERWLCVDCAHTQHSYTEDTQHTDALYRLMDVYWRNLWKLESYNWEVKNEKEQSYDHIDRYSPVSVP